MLASNNKDSKNKLLAKYYFVKLWSNCNLNLNQA